MESLLAQRRYRLGLQLATRSARQFFWWIAIGVPGTLAISLIFADALEIGAWSITASILQWFVGIWSGMSIHLFLPTRIATGLTRREITVALAVHGALLSAGAVLIVAAGFFAEHALLSAVADPPLTLGETAVQAARYVLVTPLYCAAGLALGAAETRMRGGNAQVLAILLVAAALGVVCMAFEYGQWWFPEWTPAGVGLIAALSAAFALFLRDVPVHPRRV